MPTEQLTVAVITGGHSYDVINFHKLFREIPGIDAYIQHIDDFATSPDAVRDSYDVLLFYIMMREGPTDELPGYRGKPKQALEHLGETEQGIVILHHGLLAYPEWPHWNELVGITDRTLHGYAHDETMTIRVTDPHHPITKDLPDWTLVDETYNMADAGPDNEILLTVDHPNSMRTVAWTRQYQRSHVFCCQLGHDNQAWENVQFRTVLTRGIHWSVDNSL
ncbi:MAG: ThuA domain-containing protein [Caldilineaceae bacterium]|nr:ThuA domain-containing protein [Caldilineaceae bacterium]